MLSKEQTFALLGSLATASITGVGLAIGGTIGATILAGIGIHVSSSIIHNGCLNLKERWLHSENGLLNHDVQRALARAFKKSVSSLASKYFETEQAANLEKHEKESIKELFEELQENAETRLLASLETIQLDSDVEHFLLNVPNVNAVDMWERIVGDEFVSEYGNHIKDFIRQNLLNETLLCFGEELKTDNRDCNRAWRAFQRMILEGVYADVRAVRTSQEKIDQDLQKLDILRYQIDELQHTIDRRLPDELFQRELEAVMGEISSTLQTIAQTSVRIDGNVEVIRADVRTLLKRIDPTPPASVSPQIITEELAEIRMNMLSAQSAYDLKEALYKVEEFLSKNPNYYEARLLRDQTEVALRREAPTHAALEEVGGAPSVHRGNRTIRWAVISGLLVLLYLLLRWLRVV